MKKKILLIIILFTFFRCTISESPEFVKISNVSIVSIKNDTARVKANAFFKNKNSIGGKLTTDKIGVFFEGDEIAQVFTSTTEVPANKEFFIPLEAVIPTKKLLQNNKNKLISNILNIVLSKTITLHFKGKITYEKFFLTKDFIIDSKEEIKLSK